MVSSVGNVRMESVPFKSYSKKINTYKQTNKTICIYPEILHVPGGKRGCDETSRTTQLTGLGVHGCLGPGEPEQATSTAQLKEHRKAWLLRTSDAELQIGTNYFIALSK